MAVVDASTGKVPGAAGDIQTHLFRRVLRRPIALVSFLWLLIVAICAVFAGWIEPFDPDKLNTKGTLLSPTGSHPFGTDSLGRDVLSRMIAGAQNSLGAAMLAVLIALTIGALGGLLAGYFGGWFDGVASWVSSMLQALPGIVVLLAARTVIGQSVWAAMAIFGVIISPQFFRLMHVTVRGVRNELYVDAARVSGLRDSRIIFRHVLRVVRAPVIIQTAIVSAIAISVQAGLALLALTDAQIPTWGLMLSDGFSRINSQAWLLLWPVLALAFVTVSLALLANTLRDELAGGRPASATPPALPAATTAAAPEPGSDPASAAPRPLLAVRGLVVGYPVAGAWSRVVDGASLDVGRGEVVGLVGESGSGKTQTAFAVMGLLPAGGRVLGGSIRFDGGELVGSDSRAMAAMRGRGIGYVPQEPMSNLDPSFTVGAQLTEPLRCVRGLSRVEARDRALELLARVGIPNPTRTFRSYPHELSGGMAQRVLIAGAVSCKPELIIADEPTTALDVTVQAEILDLLRELQRDSNTALLLVTHNFGVVADLCDRVAVMQRGAIVESGPVRQIFSNPEHPYTRSLLDATLDDAPARAPYHAEAVG